MKKKLLPVVLISLILGMALTFLYTTHTKWVPIKDCVATVTTKQKQKGDLPTVPIGNCSIQERGFPQAYLTSEIGVNINLNDNGRASYKNFEVYNMPKYDAGKLVANWLIWSGAAFLAIGIVYYLRPKKRAPKGDKTKA